MQPSRPSSYDLHLFHEGNLIQAWRTFGAHPASDGERSGVRFTVWAPHAQDVCLVGDFNDWDGSRHPMERSESPGVWTLFVPGLSEGALYKYAVRGADGVVRLKADPFAFYAELRPGTASIVYDVEGFAWTDAEYRAARDAEPSYGKPLNIYEVHLGSWKIKGKEQFYTYEQLSEQLVDYVSELGYTHIELLPISEHPFDRSWGYQATGYYAPTSRYGTPHQLMKFVDRCHANGIGVILDWVPAHFCRDDHGLRRFDGTPLYEYADERKADKPQWGTLSFDYGRPEVVSFLVSNAMYWFEAYHIDGLRVDAVASMLELNFDKPEHMRVTNEYGGTDNLEAMAFLKKLNQTVFRYFPSALMMAEDSSDRPLVTAPTHAGGIGFNYKWNMGWMNDTLRYMEMDPIYRKHHHTNMNFSMSYAYSENFVLPLSHDEVVHGKKSLLDKMPGDYWHKFAGLRALYGYMMTHPGKKLLFMGGELGMFSEWKDLGQVDWHLLDYDMHRKLFEYVKRLNRLYRREPSLWEQDYSPLGFEWIDADNAEQSILLYARRGRRHDDAIVVLCNFAPVARQRFRIGVPLPGAYREALNSDAENFGGSNVVNAGPIRTEPVAMHRYSNSLTIDVPPLAAVILKLEEKGEQADEV